MNLFQILETLCEDDVLTVVSGVKFVLKLIQYAIPCALIILGTIDMFKAMTSGDEKATKEIQKKFVKRLVYAAVAFLIPFIVSLTFTMLSKVIVNDDTKDAKDTSNTFFECWNNA